MKYKIQKEELSNSPKGESGYIKDIGTIEYSPFEKKRREYGAHLTSIDIFKKFILSEIKDILYKYSWVDLFCGEGNLILPILELIPMNERIDFSYKLAKKNIQIRDTLQNYPNFKFLKYPPYHVTNPPYLYIGYIVKNSERNLKYFTGPNEGYQDLYQIAMMNDLRHGLEKLIYIIPTNFLFGFSVSNKIRKDFLPFYNIKKTIIFEKRIFQFTGTNVCICFFERKSQPSNKPIIFKSLKINTTSVEKEYCLSPENFYRAGGMFDEFVSYFKSPSPLKIKFYLTLEEVKRNKGKNSVKLLDVNNFSNGYFKFNTYLVNNKLYEKIKSNPLFVRTLDTGGWDGRVGIYNIKEIFNVDGILVTKEKYRTHPIQIFITPELSEEDLFLLKNYFNLMLEYFRNTTDSEFLTTFKYSMMLEYFRNTTDSEFLTTFKYSNSNYVRKYLGLTQVRKLIETFPVHLFSKEKKNILKILIEQKNIEGIKEILLDVNKSKNQITLF